MRGRDYAREAGISVLEAIVCDSRRHRAALRRVPMGRVRNVRSRTAGRAGSARAGRRQRALRARGRCQRQGRADESVRLFADYEAALIERGDEHGARTEGQNRGFGLYLAGDLEGAEPVYRLQLGRPRRARRTRLSLDPRGAPRARPARARPSRGGGGDPRRGRTRSASEDDWLTDAFVAVVRARLASLDGRHDEGGRCRRARGQSSVTRGTSCCGRGSRRSTAEPSRLPGATTRRGGYSRRRSGSPA